MNYLSLVIAGIMVDGAGLAVPNANPITTAPFAEGIHTSELQYCCESTGDHSPEKPVTKPRASDCLTLLRQTLERESKWIKVHSAEFLLELGEPKGVQTAFESERERHESQPQYRIGIWRVLAQTALQEQERLQWMEKIRAVIIDPKAVDRIHALESLAKLGDPLTSVELRVATKAAADKNLPTAPYARWLLASSGGTAELNQLSILLQSDDTTVRLVTAYALQWLKTKNRNTRLKLGNNTTSLQQIGKLLQETADHESPESPAYHYLVAAAWIYTSELPNSRKYRDALLKAASTDSSGARMAAATVLSEIGDSTDVAILSTWLKDPNPDVVAHAAATILKIEKRMK